MTIVEMMTEIRKDYPGVVSECLGPKYDLWVVRQGRKTLGRSHKLSDAVLAAYRAVRKARPKPMTVAEAKAAVKAEWSGAKCGKAGGHWYVYDPDSTEWIGLGMEYTEGQAWKAAAAAIAAKDGQ